MTHYQSFIRNNVPEAIQANLTDILNIIGRYEQLWTYFPDGKARQRLQQVHKAFLQLTCAVDVPFNIKFSYLNNIGDIPTDFDYLVLPNANKLSTLPEAYRDEFGSLTHEQVILDRTALKTNLLKIVDYCVREIESSM